MLNLILMFFIAEQKNGKQDSPVGSGYSFVEEKDLYVKSDEEAAKDLTTLLQQLFNKNQILNQSPLYIVAESYGGKIAVKLGLSVIDSVQSGNLKLHLGGKIFLFSLRK